nr:uncharacterized protein LOC123763481 [Procambarus clarkii]
MAVYVVGRGQACLRRQEQTELETGRRQKEMKYGGRDGKIDRDGRSSSGQRGTAQRLVAATPFQLSIPIYCSQCFVSGTLKTPSRPTAADTNGTAADTNGTSSGTNGTAADANGTTSGTNDTSTGTNSTSTATNGTSPGTNNGNNGNNGSNSTANSTSTGTTNGTNTTASGATSTNGTNTTATGATSTNGTNTTATGATSTNGTNTTTTGTTSTNGTNTTTTGAASTNGTNTTATGTTSTNGTNTTSSSNSTTTNSTTNANGTSGTNSTRRKRSVADGDEELVEAVDGGQVLLQVTQAPDEVPEVPDEVPQVPDEVDEDCDLDTEVKRIAQINQIADDVIREGGQNEVIEEGSGTASEDRIGGPDGIVISRRRKRDTDLTSSYGGVVIVSPFRTVTKTVVDKGVLFRTNGTTSLCSCTPDFSNKLKELRVNSYVNSDVLGTDVNRDVLGTDVNKDVLGTDVNRDVLGTDVNSDVLGTDVNSADVESALNSCGRDWDIHVLFYLRLR